MDINGDYLNWFVAKKEKKWWQRTRSGPHHNANAIKNDVVIQTDRPAVNWTRWLFSLSRFRVTPIDDTMWLSLSGTFYVLCLLAQHGHNSYDGEMTGCCIRSNFLLILLMHRYERSLLIAWAMGSSGCMCLLAVSADEINCTLWIDCHSVCPFSAISFCAFCSFCRSARRAARK